MKSVSDNLLEIAANFQDSADIFELKADNLFAKVKTFLLDSENRLTQVLTINALRIIDTINPIHSCLDEKISNLSTSTFNMLNDLPTKDFVFSTSEQYSLIFSNKLIDLEERICSNLSSLKTELLDIIISLADITGSSDQNLQLSQRNIQSEKTNKKHFKNKDEDVEFKPKDYKRENKKHKPPGKNEDNDEHTNIKIKIMKAAKTCESMEDLLHSLNNIDIFNSPINFNFHIPEIHGIEDP
jgi:hypothetical protein